jgi:nicotinate-nucleotide adenylyltransferase
LDENYVQRFEAAKKAVQEAGLERVVVSDFEAGLPLPSYTANTLRELRKKYPEHEFSLIIGEDNWDVFDKWREYEYILQNYRIFIYPRHSNSKEKKNFNCPLSNVNYLSGAPYFDISSTEIRNGQHIK